MAMSKQQQFLWAVQTTMLTNSIALMAETTKEEVPLVALAHFAMGRSIDALQASERIPDHLSAGEAAAEWCGYMLDNLREPKAEVPSWFANC